MITHYLLKGFVIGFSVAAPVGPIGVLCIKRTLYEGKLSGFITGMGAAVADTVYGIIAGFGLTTISVFMLKQVVWMKLFGSFFLIYLGIKSFFAKSKNKEITVKSDGHFKNFVSTFFLTISNPTTILSFLGIFAGLGIEAPDYISSSILVLGVFIGSAIWWLILSSMVGFFRTKITVQKLSWIDQFSGIILFVFGAFTLYSIFKK